MYYITKKDSETGKKFQAIQQKMKEIQAKSDNASMIIWKDLNACIGLEESSFHIGFEFNNDTYFGFTAEEEWEVEVPADCEEITFTQWREIFKEE